MSQNESSSSPVSSSAQSASQSADAMIEHRYPSDIDRLREVVGTDVLPRYRDEQAIVASQQASARWPHLVAVADSRGMSAPPAPSAPPSSAI